MLAIVYIAAAILAFRRRYPLWGLWLLLWAPVVATWAPKDAHWGATIYTPLLAISTAALGLATIEAFFGHARKYPLAVSVSIGLGFLAISAGWSVWHYYEQPANTGAIVRQYALSVRMGCAVLLLLALAFWASWGWLRWTASLRHVVVVMLMAGSFAVGSLLLGRVDKAQWYATDAAIQWGRAVLLVTWTIVVKAKQVKTAELEAQAEKARRVTEAEGQAQVTVLQAKAQSASMQYTLPLKQKQIEQTRLEAEARAQAKVIDGKAELERRKLMNLADVDRVEVLSKADYDRLRLEAGVLKDSPILLQKIIADKLSDKVQIMMVPSDGKFFFSNDVLRGGSAALPMTMPAAQTGQQER
jgi:hypothetical protein